MLRRRRPRPRGKQPALFCRWRREVDFRQEESLNPTTRTRERLYNTSSVHRVGRTLVPAAFNTNESFKAKESLSVLLKAQPHQVGLVPRWASFSNVARAGHGARWVADGRGIRYVHRAGAPAFYVSTNDAYVRGGDYLNLPYVDTCDHATSNEVVENANGKNENERRKTPKKKGAPAPRANSKKKKRDGSSKIRNTKASNTFIRNRERPSPQRQSRLRFRPNASRE